jgi:hypothetical protein
MLHLLVVLATALAFSVGATTPPAQGNAKFSNHGAPIAVKSNDGGDNISGGGPPGHP